MSLVRELVHAGFLVQIHGSQVVVGHKLDLKYEPYRFWRINRVDQWHNQDHHAVPMAPNPLNVQFPHDKYEYWDYLTDKALETHQRLQDNAEERERERADNIAELRRTMEEVWGKPKLTTLHSMLMDQEKQQREREIEKRKLKQQVTNPEEQQA